jgi:hypothetical protein
MDRLLESWEAIAKLVRAAMPEVENTLDRPCRAGVHRRPSGLDRGRAVVVVCLLIYTLLGQLREARSPARAGGRAHGPVSPSGLGVSGQLDAAVIFLDAVRVFTRARTTWASPSTTAILYLVFQRGNEQDAEAMLDPRLHMFEAAGCREASRSTAAISARSTGNSASGSGRWRSRTILRDVHRHRRRPQFADLEHPRNLNAMSSSCRWTNPPAGDQKPGEAPSHGMVIRPALDCPQ